LVKDDDDDFSLKRAIKLPRRKNKYIPVTFTSNFNFISKLVHKVPQDIIQTFSL